MRNNSIPSIFKGAKEYKEIPEALEPAQATFNEKGLYQAITSFAIDWFKSKERKARVLDLCSATGLCALRVAKAIPVSDVTLVDTDRGALKKGVGYFTDVCPVTTHCVDAVTFRDDKLFDIILMNSAYHHIEDDRKVAFLQTAANLLCDDGVILVGEHFLPPYKDREEFRQSVIAFYTKLLQEFEQRNEPVEAIDVTRRAGLYCWEGVYEYKVSMERFLCDITAAELVLLWKKGVWLFPCDKTDSVMPDVGSFALLLIPERSGTVLWTPPLSADNEIR